MKKKCRLIKIEDNTGVIIGDVGPYDSEMCVISNKHNRGDIVGTRPLYHLYAIFDGTLRKGDHYVNIDTNEICVAGEYTSVNIANNAPSCKKIIATTNTKFIYPEVNKGDILRHVNGEIHTVVEDRGEIIVTSYNTEIGKGEDWTAKSLNKFKDLKGIATISTIFCENYCKKPVKEILVDFYYDNYGINQMSTFYNSIIEPCIDSNNDIIIYDILDYTREEVEKLLDLCWEAAANYTEQTDRIFSGQSNLAKPLYLNKKEWLNKNL